MKLHRQALDSDVFADPDLWYLFSWCLLSAGHKERHLSAKTGRGRTLITVGPGQFIYGRKSAARELRLKESTLRNRMKRLESLGTIVIQPDTHFSLVTLTNWSTYQASSGDGGHPTGQAKDRQATGKGQRKNTTKNGEKGKNGENVKNGETVEARRDDHRCSWGVIGGDVRELAREVSKTVRVKPSARQSDRSLILKACYLVKAGRMPEHWLRDAVEAVKQGKTKSNAAAYFHRCLTEGATKLGQHLPRLLTSCNGAIPADVLTGNGPGARQASP